MDIFGELGMRILTHKGNLDVVELGVMSATD
jgi:hypothetical protein